MNEIIPSPSPHTPAQSGDSRRTRALRWLWCILPGVGAGLLNGLLGTAGGILLVTLLPRLTPPQRLAPPYAPDPLPLGETHERRDLLATSLCTMLPVSAISAVLYMRNGHIPPWNTLAILALPAIAGGLLGAFLLGRLPNRFLKKLFATLVIVAGLRMLF